MPDLDAEYARMAVDDDREAKARAWAEALMADAFDESDEEPES